MTVERMAIVDSTLREGEQFAGADFTTGQKLEIVAALDEFGVDYIEMTSPAASPQSEADLRAVVAARPRARVLTHTRCSIGMWTGGSPPARTASTCSSPPPTCSAGQATAAPSTR